MSYPCAQAECMDFYSEGYETALMLCNRWLYNNSLQRERIISIQHIDNHNHIELWYFKEGVPCCN